MMGHRQVEQAALFYEFSLERHVPADHLLRSIDRFVELGGLLQELAAFAVPQQREAKARDHERGSHHETHGWVPAAKDVEESQHFYRLSQVLYCGLVIATRLFDPDQCSQ